MEFAAVLFGIITLIALVFVVTHLRSLTEDEVERLARKRRDTQVSRYFSFHNREVRIDREFKKRMKPTGTFCRLSEGLFGFPSTAAALLKYKKHEWIIVAFEKDKYVDMIWVNKGPDRSQVSLALPVLRIVEVARQHGYRSVLTFHNHPNPDPAYLDCTRPSERDLNTASERARILNSNGVNLLSFVCERGVHYKYLLSTAKTFLPLSGFVANINNINGLSRLRNLSLHLERIF